MRGKTSSEEVSKGLSISVDRRYREDFVARRLREDCRGYKPDTDLLDALAQLRDHAFVVLATDNMDCFADAVADIKDLSMAIDYVLCSSDLGYVKDDGVSSFFGPWLSAHGIPLMSALLIDDSADTCATFRSAGGTAIPHDNTDQTILNLYSWIDG